MKSHIVMIIVGFIMLGLVGLFYSYRFLGFEGDYTAVMIEVFSVAIMFFGLAGWFYFKDRKKINKDSSV